VKAGIIDESFRGADYEAGSPLNGMNTGEPSYAGLLGLVKVLSALSPSLPVYSSAGGSFRGYRLSPCIACENDREREEERDGRGGQIFSFVLSEYRRGNAERTESGESARYPKNRPTGTPWRKDVVS